ncbi:hypothetical protein CerSpe_240010 [Prunus speciosa]
MGLTGVYNSPVTDDDGISIIKYAFSKGITFFDTSDKEIGRAKEYIVKQLGLEKGQSVDMGTIHGGDFMRRFCSNLGINNQAVKAAQEPVQSRKNLI